METYTKEQEEEIKVRYAQVVEQIKKFEFTLSAQVIPTNIGNDVFGFKVVPFLADTKYSKKEEPKVETTEAEAPKITDVEATPTVSPFVAQPNTDENNTDSKTA